jgi:hypothetical protein
MSAIVEVRGYTIFDLNEEPSESIVEQGITVRGLPDWSAFPLFRHRRGPQTFDGQLGERASGFSGSS